MTKNATQRGISVPQVLVVLGIVTVLAMVYMGVVRNQLKQTGFEQATITTSYIAEIGFQQIRSDLAKVSGNWQLIPGIVSDCNTSTNPYASRCQKLPQDSSYSQFRVVRENPLDSNSRILGIYEAAVETGEKRSIFGYKTLTGATVGYVPASTQSNEKIGYDRFGNKLCEQSTTSTCPGKYLGIQINAWLTDAKGNLMPKTRKQSLYGVIELSTGVGEDGPAGYLIDTNDALVVRENTLWNPTAMSNQVVSGWYGPVHTNSNYLFYWESLNDETLTRGNPANTAELSASNRMAPYGGVLQIDKGSQWVGGIQLYQPGTDLNFTPYGFYWFVNWSKPGSEPSPGQTYTVNFAPPNGAAPATVTKGSANGSDFLPGATTSGASSIVRGATTYSAANDYAINSQAYIDWSPTGLEPSSGTQYKVRHIAHQPIAIFGKMTYSGGASQFRYRHEHAVSGASWPLYQAGHAHSNVAGAAFSTNAVTDYDGGTWVHEHTVGTDLLSAPPNPNTYLTFTSNAYRPTSGNAHLVPLLKPIPIASDPGQQNYLNQLEQLNKYLQLTLGISMPRNTDGTLNPTTLPNTSDYNNGYLVGNAALNPPNVTVFDYRAAYFGASDLEYSAGASSGTRIITDGSPIDTTANIWVNENDTTSDYMRIAATQINSNYRRFTFRQIPPGQILLVRDGLVKIGNYKPKSPIVSCSSVNGDCKDDPVYDIGQSTIIDGKLTIVSFTTTPPPNSDAYNKGDIIIAGNIRYRNYVVYDDSDPTAIRQLDPHPESPYSQTLSTSPAIDSLSDADGMWVTNTDGSLFRDANGNPVGRLCGLGLFASNEIKISTMHYYVSSETSAHKDMVQIKGELVAGNKIRAFNPTPSQISNYDEFHFYGTVYSLTVPSFANYFNKYRTYLYDKALFVNPLMGAPYFPKAQGDYKNQTVFNNFPKLVPGTWQQLAQ